MTRRIRRKKPASDDPSISRFFELFFDRKPEPRGRPPEYRVDVLRERLAALTKELTRRYKKQGTWPETGTKWAVGTEKYLRLWWRHGLDELAEWQRLPERPFPTEAIAVRLRSPKGRLPEGDDVLPPERTRGTQHAPHSEPPPKQVIYPASL